MAQDKKAKIPRPASLKTYVFSWKDKGSTQVVQAVPHTLLVAACDSDEAMEYARTFVKEEGGNLRSIKSLGVLLAACGDCYGFEFDSFFASMDKDND